MKRPVRWVLAILVSGLSLVAVLFCNAFYRSHRLLREQLESAKSDLETFPPEATRRLAIFDPEEAGNAWDLEIKALGSFSLQSLIPDLDDGWGLYFDGHEILPSDHSVFPSRDIEEVFGELRRALHRMVVLPSGRPGGGIARWTTEIAFALISSAAELHREGKDLEAAEHLVLAIGFAEDVSRHGDYRNWHALELIEYHTSWIASQILSAHNLTTSELETWGTWMDRLKKARPTVVSNIAVDSAVTRKNILEDFAGVTSYSTNASPPEVPITWRNLWSGTLAKSSWVQSIDRAARALSEQSRLPGWERKQPIVSEPDGAFSFHPDARVLEVDAASELYLLLWRTSIALAWFETERGEFPKSLDELIPRYLPEKPVSPRTGGMLEYDQGKLSTDPGPRFLEEVLAPDGSVLNLFHWKIGHRVR